MTEETPTSKHSISADWLFRGVLTKLGDTFDRFTGRRWIPSSSLATSELIERLKGLLDAEAKEIPGKGLVVPHNISLKMQWDKFSDDAEKGIAALRTELLTAAADHINDSLYFTLAPLRMDVKTDYFTEGVKLSASFDKFNEIDRDVEMSVTIPSVKLDGIEGVHNATTKLLSVAVVARYVINNLSNEKLLRSAPNERISVGRAGENMLVIDDPSVSKMHASVVVAADGSMAVADTGSTNGTFINDERITYGLSVPFGSSDKIRFGSVEVSFEREPEPPETEAASEAEPLDDTMQIGGFEFRSKSPTAPALEGQPAPVLTASGAPNIEHDEIDAPDILPNSTITHRGTEGDPGTD